MTQTAKHDSKDPLLDLHLASDIQIYTDGSCTGNPGPGGFGALVWESAKNKDRPKERFATEIFGGEAKTTNNRMELMAVISALKFVTSRDDMDAHHLRILILSDSKYVLDGIQSWIVGWKKNNWRTSGKKPVVNQDLWMLLDELVSPLTISWKWVRGHSGDVGNEKADALAQEGTRYPGRTVTRNYRGDR